MSVFRKAKKVLKRVKTYQAKREKQVLAKAKKTKALLKERLEIETLRAKTRKQRASGRPVFTQPSGSPVKQVDPFNWGLYNTPKRTSTKKRKRRRKRRR